jgi:hypothetical protein
LIITCPLCNQADPLYSKRRKIFICEYCDHEFVPEASFDPQRIFVSYGRDEHMSLACQLLEVLPERGHEVLAEHCWQEYLSGVKALSTYTLRFLPAHLIAAKRFDDLIGDEQTPGPLTDLHFIQARCEARLVDDLVNDYNLAINELPEFKEEQKYLHEHEKAMRTYNKALNDYAVKHYDYLQSREKALECNEPPCPEMPEILRDDKRPPFPEESSDRAARLRHFANFVSRYKSFLKAHPEETLPIAYNDSSEGPVSLQSEKLIEGHTYPWLRRSPRPPAYPPSSAVSARTKRPQLSGH